ncbi:TadE/TadG family type IV pilus assembly protein [Solicola sp. PLA-1-18]|uniref:TadE/TadG family type IV pilus assembly protein n=1 Tax=Solicola sp. PLA-1-18 TaxID=3380532 RepID=UPI003B7D8646
MTQAEGGAAVVDFCLVMVVLVPLVLGVMQVALVLHVRNTMTAAASEGARYAATVDAGPEQGAARTRTLIDQGLASRYARDVTATQTDVDGLPGTRVVARAEVPALGLLGPGLAVEVEGNAVEEALP